ncbi:MAG: M15 family metallopeptidase [Cypionkella sp.]|nr:M15 family metallopeptidase [Cypionkella sp.]
MLAALNYYKGAMVGPWSDADDTAVDIVLRNAGMTAKAAKWSWERRAAAAMQIILNSQGHEAGAVDGLIGHNTREALASWWADRTGERKDVPRNPVVPPIRGVLHLPRQSECAAFYGDPGKGQVEKRIKLFDLPFPMRLDYDLDVTVRRVSLHEKCGDAFAAALEAVASHYGMARLKDLGLDRYAGGYMHRRMRGGSSWSMHAYGCAVDIYAAPNGLRTRCPKALFCAPEYQPFLDIMQAHGWLPAIRLWGADAMHFQMARL